MMKKIGRLGFLLAVLALTGCAATKPQYSANEPKLLSEAGFTPKTPKTDKQKEAYDDLNSHELVKGKVNGQQLYGYKDPEAGVIYVGSDKQYRTYLKLAEKERVPAMTATEMDPEIVARYKALVPYGYWR